MMNRASPAEDWGIPNANAPQIRRLTVRELLNLDIPAPQLLIEEVLPTPGAVLLVGQSKSGKTVMAIQTSIAVASGHSLFGHYRVKDTGPVLFIEQDDPGAEGSVKDYLRKSPVPNISMVAFHLVPKLPFVFGDRLTAWLKTEIIQNKYRLIVLDSYTALRASHTNGSDIVKAEHYDLIALDELAKQTKSTIIVLHHVSTSKATLDWDTQAAGTFAMAAAVEAQIHIARFSDLDGSATERLVRVRGRHIKGAEFVLRFREETLDYEHVTDGAASSLYPLILQIQSEFANDTFSPKELSQATGNSRATAHRHIDRLYRASVLTKLAHGQYRLVKRV